MICDNEQLSTCGVALSVLRVITFEHDLFRLINIAMLPRIFYYRYFISIY